MQISAETKHSSRGESVTPPNPAETAREAIRRLARDKLPPTPENFAAMYFGITGQTSSASATANKRDNGHTEQAIRTALVLADRFPAIPRQRDALVAAIRNGAWHAVDDLVADLRVVATAAQPAHANPTGGWRETAQSALQCSAPLYLSTPDLKRDAANQLQAIRNADSEESIKPIRQSLMDFAGRLAAFHAAEERSHLQLKSLMSAIVKNVSCLSAEQGWLSGQMARVDQVLSGGGDENALRNIEATLRDATRRQDDLKKQLDMAKDALRDLLTSFISKLGEMSESTGDFSTRVGHYAIAIESAENLASVTDVVKHLLSDTRGLHTEMNAAKDELTEAQSLAAHSEARVKRLEAELLEVSDLVRTDHLTQALNRRGLDSAYEAEAARAERGGTPLCIAVIDIDNFKALNDKHGHHAGDDALRHLSKVMRNALRPTDVLARHGGEEFMVLLPDTPLDTAMKVTERLQRQLTREFFLHAEEKLFITFSAGVTTVIPGEAQQASIDRADRALYAAKNAGKNRVVAG